MATQRKSISNEKGRKMKILHVGTYLHDGAGLGMLRLHRDLLARGVDSRVLVMSDVSDDPRIAPLLLPQQRRPRRLHDVPEMILHRLHLYDAPYYHALRVISECKKYKTHVSSPFTRIDIVRHPWAQEADVVHLHWIAGFIDWPLFFRQVSKPVVWTLRDESPALGFWHFRTDMPDPMPQVLQKEDNWLRDYKASILRSCKSLSIISLSSDEDAFFSKTCAFTGRNHKVIPNSVNPTAFSPGGGETIRKEFGIAQDAVVLSFVAQWLNEHRKGFEDLDAALCGIGIPNIVVLCVGRGSIPKTASSARFVKLGLVEDPRRLASVFSASNLFVTPSKAETFGKTTTEALACGVPVVSYPNSGAKDIVSPNDGVLADDFTPEALRRAIQKALSSHYDTTQIRSRTISRFSSEVVANAYVKLYRDVLESAGHSPAT